jgi:hypothetical protein
VEKGGTESADGYALTSPVQFGMCFFVRKRIISAVNTIEFRGSVMSYVA